LVVTQRPVDPPASRTSPAHPKLRQAQGRPVRTFGRCSGCGDDTRAMIEIRHRQRRHVLATVRADTLVGADLRGKDLEAADLRGQNLQRADLRGVSLQDADLRGANLAEANLRAADLRGADLRRANLWGAALQDARLQGADLRGASLCSANLAHAQYDTGTQGLSRFHAFWENCDEVPRPTGPSEVLPAEPPGGRGDEAIPPE